MSVVRGLTTAQQGYGGGHQELRKRFMPLVLAGGVKCARCGQAIAPNEPWDLGHVDGDKSRYAGPEHRACNRRTAGRRPWEAPLRAELEPERDGIPAADPVWAVPWLKSFRKVPADATWPRLMTVPHPQAAGSLGPGFIRWAQKRSGRPLRWWQKLVATRLLEIDADGQLVWETALWSTARQVGKSWLLRELLLWRIHQAERFGEPQDVLHTGKDLAVCKEVQRPARLWAKARPGTYKVREVNGQEEIEYQGSRWMLRAKEAVYGYSVSCAAADEAWKVKPSSIEEGLTPTMVERVQPQLWLVSTAHRLATSLMLARRQVALVDLEDGNGDLLIEWSAPEGSPYDERQAWRLASPHWSERRERLIAKQLHSLLAGEIDDPEEPDPEAFFRAQWLNQWPRKLTEPAGVPSELLPLGQWAALEDVAEQVGPLHVAVEDDYGLGAAVGVACLVEDGRVELDGRLCVDWADALDYVARLGEWRRIQSFQVGASMLQSVPLGYSPQPIAAGTRETKTGLALLRDLCNAGAVIHHDSPELDRALAMAKVREAPSGLYLLEDCPRHLIHAVVWALQAAAQVAPEPAIY
jgi:hypothetical protein